MPGEPLGEVGNGAEEALAAVEHEKGHLVGQGLDQDVVDAPARLLGDTGGLGNGPRDRGRVRKGGQLHEPGTVGEAVHDVERDLDRQPRLADTPQSHDAHDAFGREQRGERRPLLCSPHEARSEERQVVNHDPDQPQRRESLAKVRVSELEQALGLWEAAQLERSERDQAGAGGQPILDGGRRGLGEQDLAPMGSGADAGHLMHGEVDVIAPDRSGLTGVHPDPHPHLGSGWPRVGRKRSLTLQTGGDRLGSVVEDEEERVPFGADLHAAMVDEGASKQRLVGAEQFDVPLAELAEEAGRTLDVGHEEGDHPGGQRCARCSRSPEGSRAAPVVPAGPVPDHAIGGPSHRGTSSPVSWGSTAVARSPRIPGPPIL